MNPPKITRPPEPEVQHTFPAWYRNTNTNIIFLAYEPDVVTCTKTGMRTNGGIDVRDPANWERLPSGTTIEFTQP